MQLKEQSLMKTKIFKSSLKKLNNQIRIDMPNNYNRLFSKESVTPFVIKRKSQNMKNINNRGNKMNIEELPAISKLASTLTGPDFSVSRSKNFTNEEIRLLDIKNPEIFFLESNKKYGIDINFIYEQKIRKLVEEKENLGIK